MRVLIACEFSGRIREEFRLRGHDAWSCDYLPTEIPGQHIQGNVLEIVDEYWDLMICHPPCDYLCNAQVHLLNRDEETLRRGWIPRRQLREEAYEFAMTLFNSKVKKVCMENPVGYINTCFRTHDQIIHPWMFGDPVTKETALWLKNLPKLIPTNVVNAGPLHWWGMPPGPERKKNKSRTFPGIAKAMAQQWG